MSRAVFLDRDGVIDRVIVRDGKPCPPADLSELEILPGVREALHKLRDGGFRLVVVTNQPDVARGRQTREMVEEMHAMLLAQLPLDGIRVCYHDDGDRCDCRKPKPGLLLSAARDMALDLPASFMVGDRWRDIEAGRRAGCTTLFIEYHFSEPLRSPPHVRVHSLIEAANWILSESGTEEIDEDT